MVKEIPLQYKLALKKGQKLGLFDEDWHHTHFFIELTDNATNDFNNDPQFRNKFLRKVTHPLFQVFTQGFDPHIVARATLHGAIGARICELIGEGDDVELVKFVTLYLLFLEDIGMLHVQIGRRPNE